MDLKVSQKSTMPQPQAGTTVEVLTANTFDLYPIFDSDDPTLIVDAFILNDDRDELLDRTMFSTVKQRGGDPIDPTTGVQWAEAVLGEVSVAAIMGQIQAEVQKEGPGVNVAFTTNIDSQGRQLFQFSVSLTNAV